MAAAQMHAADAAPQGVARLLARSGVCGARESRVDQSRFYAMAQTGGQGRGPHRIDPPAVQTWVAWAHPTRGDELLRGQGGLATPKLANHVQI